MSLLVVLGWGLASVGLAGQGAGSLVTAERLTRASTEAGLAASAAVPAFEARVVAGAEAAGVSMRALGLALRAVRCGVRSGDIEAPPTLTVIDYSRPSTERRLWVFDLADGSLLFSELVAHGRATGENLAQFFSDAPDSHQSSLGLFVTGENYVGRNGYSLRLDGLEPGFNGNARARAIVMHGAPYVHADLGAAQGRIGRSWGCPALREAVARDVIDTIQGGGVIFAYYPQDDWLEQSHFLNDCPSSDDDFPTTLAAR